MLAYQAQVCALAAKNLQSRAVDGTILQAFNLSAAKEGIEHIWRRLAVHISTQHLTEHGLAESRRSRQDEFGLVWIH